MKINAVWFDKIDHFTSFINAMIIERIDSSNS